MALSYLRRDEWGAVKPLKWNDLQLPLYHVYYIATQTRECSDELTCIKVCQRLQSIHLMKKYGDIRFSFMIGGDGQVYEGRGWKYAPSLPIEYRDRNQQQSILIAFIGRWVNDQVTPIMMRAASDLIDYAIDNNYLKKSYRSQNLFKDHFREEVIEEMIKDSYITKLKNRTRTACMLKEMGLNNELSPEIDTRYIFKK